MLPLVVRHGGDEHRQDSLPRRHVERSLSPDVDFFVLEHVVVVARQLDGIAVDAELAAISEVAGTEAKKAPVARDRVQWSVAAGIVSADSADEARAAAGGGGGSGCGSSSEYIKTCGQGEDKTSSANFPTALSLFSEALQNSCASIRVIGGGGGGGGTASNCAAPFHIGYGFYFTIDFLPNRDTRALPDVSDNCFTSDFICIF